MPPQEKEQVATALQQSGRFMKWLQTLIAVVVVIAGAGVTWGITRSEITHLQTQISEIKEQRKDEQILHREEVSKMQEEILSLKLKAATVDTTLNNIESDVAEIKEDVKKLVRNR